jgi:hypothetical protein
MRARTSAAYVFEVSPATGTSTKSASPRYVARSANANFIASAITWMLADEFAPRSRRSKVSTTLRISMRATPPEDAGGNE